MDLRYLLSLSITLVDRADTEKILKAACLPRSFDKSVRVQSERLNPDHKTLCLCELLASHSSPALPTYFSLIEIHWRLKYYVINRNPKKCTVAVSVVTGCKRLLFNCCHNGPLVMPQKGRGVRYFFLLKHLCYLINLISKPEFAQNTK